MFFSVKQLTFTVMIAITIHPFVLYAQQYPNRPIRLVVPFAPGGPTDILARAIGQKLTDRWKQQVVVDNRPGAAGNIGAELVAKAQADGYTLLMGTVATHGINPGLYKKLSFDAVNDFSPITCVAAVPNILVLHPSVPINSVSELIAFAKTTIPDHILFGILFPHRFVSFENF